MSGPKKILFVDDEIQVLDGMRRMLADQRRIWDMYFAAGVDDALAEIRKRPFDTVVSDITMPGRDGFDLLRALRLEAETRDLPVVILTGLNEQNVKKKALDLGATDLLHKPVDPDELKARIQSSIRQKSYLDEIKIFNETLREKVRERTRELDQSRLDMILRLGYMAGMREKTAAARVHGVKVGCYSRVIARHLGLDPVFAERLFVAATLHDIGRIAVPEQILMKKNPLTFEEWDLLSHHCQMGWEILTHRVQGTCFLFSMEGREPWDDIDPHKNLLLKMAAAIALSHHEWWNGRGYPSRLKGGDIPLEARIVALADVYDELNDEHAGHPAPSDEKALESIRKSIGEQFDPEIYVAFDKSLEEIRRVRRYFAEADKTI